jgi:hypothetical protein
VNRLDARLLRVREIQVLYELAATAAELTTLTAHSTAMPLVHLTVPLATHSAMRAVLLRRSLCTSVRGKSNDCYGAESSRANF